MVAVLAISAIAAGLVFFAAFSDVRGVFGALAVYALAGVLFQRTEGRTSSGYGYGYGYGYGRSSGRGKTADPLVDWRWRLRVVAFWLPWLVVIRGGDVVRYVVASVVFAWQFTVLGAGTAASWPARRRVFRERRRRAGESVPSLAERQAALAAGEAPIPAGDGTLDADYIEEPKANGRVTAGIR
jgi:hypothetical protein